MGIDVRWYNEEKTILYHEFSGRWTLEEFQASIEKALTLLDSVSHPVYRILHIKGRLFVPPGTSAHFRTAISQHRPHERDHFIVGGGLMITSIIPVMTMLDSALERQFIQVNTLAEAEAMIQQAIENI